VSDGGVAYSRVLFYEIGEFCHFGLVVQATKEKYQFEECLGFLIGLD
jgi:hypothetical protein